MRALSVLLLCGVLACSGATSAPVGAAQQPSPAPARQDTARAAGARPGSQAPLRGAVAKPTDRILNPR